MNTNFFYGLILAVINIVFSLVMFFAGYQTDKIAEGQRLSQFFPLVVCIVVLVLGMRAVREESKDKSLSYGRGVGSGVLITLYSSLIGAVYTFIHLTFVNTNYADYMIDFLRKGEWARKGLSETQMDAAEKFTRFIFKPAILSISSIIMWMFFGTVFVLIIAIFMRRKPVLTPSVETSVPA
jgi:hypothetical protein